MIEKRFNIAFVSSLALREKQIQQNYRPIMTTLRGPRVSVLRRDAVASWRIGEYEYAVTQAGQPPRTYQTKTCKNCELWFSAGS